MTVVAVIPARGGSKGIPLKNLQRVGGVSLVGRAIASCKRATAIDRVCVSTDDERIKNEALAHGAEVIDRPDLIAGDTASSESALTHALDHLQLTDGVLVFVQCTSPFIDPESLNEAVTRIQAGANDSVFSAVQTWDFLWSPTEQGVVGINHDLRTRPRRQELPTAYRETGAFYAMDIAGYRKAEHRFFGIVGSVEVDRQGAVDIDEPSDLELARALASVLDKRDLPDFSEVRALVMDFDGVHTDDSVFVDQHGDEAVRVSRSDGMGIRRLRDAGVQMMIISSEENPVVTKRAEKLKIEVVQGTFAKLEHLDVWLTSAGIERDQTMYIGNDVNDLECMNAVGYPVAVANAIDSVKAVAVYVTTRAGGSGAIREVADLLLGND